MALATSSELPAASWAGQEVHLVALALRPSSEVHLLEWSMDCLAQPLQPVLAVLERQKPVQELVARVPLPQLVVKALAVAQVALAALMMLTALMDLVAPTGQGVLLVSVPLAALMGVAVQQQQLPQVQAGQVLWLAGELPGARLRLLLADWRNPVSLLSAPVLAPMWAVAQGAVPLLR
mmetsp:Transcript_3142/g.7313  ORF Transcript_3142/g.7313 Transcript_3142/m.7313 type:complete len:178 (-) Transcript_3142:279-812(-)